MAVYVRKRGDESTGSLVFRFTKKVQRSGVLLEAKKRRFTKRLPNKNARRESALYRVKKTREIERMKKLGLYGS